MKNVNWGLIASLFACAFAWLIAGLLIWSMWP